MKEEKVKRDLTHQQKILFIGGFFSAIILLVLGTWLVTRQKPAVPETYVVSPLDVCQASFSLDVPSPAPSIPSCRLSLRVGPGPSVSPSPSASVNPSASVSPSPSPAAAGQIKANFDGIPDGRKNFQINLTAKEITDWSAVVQLDTSGQAGVGNIFGSAFTPSQSYNFVLNKFVPFLSKVKAAVFTANTAIDFGTAGTGDLNGDNQVNTLDWSIMKLKFGAEATLEQGDLNLDGMINTIDWSLMKKWFGQNGEI